MINKVLNSDQDVMRYSLVKTNAKWMREHFAYNPVDDLPKIGDDLIMEEMAV